MRDHGLDNRIYQTILRDRTGIEGSECALPGNPARCGGREFDERFTPLISSRERSRRLLCKRKPSRRRVAFEGLQTQHKTDSFVRLQTTAGIRPRGLVSIAVTKSNSAWTRSLAHLANGDAERRSTNRLTKTAATAFRTEVIGSFSLRFGTPDRVVHFDVIVMASNFRFAPRITSTTVCRCR